MEYKGLEPAEIPRNMKEVTLEHNLRLMNEVGELQAELHTLWELLGEAEKWIEEEVDRCVHWAPDSWSEDGEKAFYCHACISWNHAVDTNCYVKKAQALLARIAEMGKE